MKTVYSENHALHDVQYEMLSTGMVPCFETPQRVENVIRHIRDAKLGDIVTPTEHGLSPVLAIHSAQYVTFLEQAWPLWQKQYGPEDQALPY